MAKQKNAETEEKVLTKKELKEQKKQEKHKKVSANTLHSLFIT